MIRVVLDTNVLVSGLLWEGPPNKILRKIDEGLLIACLNESMLREVDEVLKRPKFLKRLQRLGLDPAEATAAIASKTLLFRDSKIPPWSLRDPNDAHVLSCALSSRAAIIVTGDDDLLVYKSFQAIPILTPGQFLKQIG